jgi:hypothetical protein
MLTIHNGISKPYQLGLFACLSTVEEEIYLFSNILPANGLYLIAAKASIMKGKVYENRKNCRS